MNFPYEDIYGNGCELEDGPEKPISEECLRNMEENEDPSTRESQDNGIDS